jgi:hypothetical protein
MKGRYLITTTDFFYGTDGSQYRAAWGDVEIISDDFLGIKTNRGSANWFAKVGTEESHVIIAGCQIHYAIKCLEKPDTDGMKDYSTSSEHGVKIHNVPNVIWVCDQDKKTGIKND